MKVLLLFICLCSAVWGCTANQTVSGKTAYVWSEVTEAAQFPPSYNYPVFILNGEMLALNEGGWISNEGKSWTRTSLSESGLNPAYQKHVQFNGAIYALGALQGNYLDFKITRKILRTNDGKSWETASEKSNLPGRIFYGTAVFKNKIWLIGGFDGKNYHNDVWNSEDGVKWTRAAEKTAWTPRNISSLFVFKDRLWFIGGGVIDGEKEINPNSGKEVWSSADGINWEEVKINATQKLGGTPVVFDDKLWLIGGNRNDGKFGNAVFMSNDGINWQAQSAPWSPRGGTVVWIFGGKLFMTGGKYSYTENGEIKFVYSNDIWALSKKTE